jgi:beta-N-acetylhexosaminidase
MTKKRFPIALGGICLLTVVLLAVYCAVSPWGKVTAPSVIVRKPATPSPEQCVARLPDSFLVGQVLIVGISGQDLADRASILKQFDIGGVVLTSAPVDPSDGSIQAFKAAAANFGVSPIIASDEEGGMIQRFTVLGVLPSPQEVAATMTPAQAQQMVTRYGQKLKAVGVDMVLGPLADVAPVQSNSVLGSRVFSNNPQIVADFAQAYVRGWEAAGLVPVLKHFPGMGSATGNTDYTLATTPPLSSLQQRDFIPYENDMAATGTAVMVGNQIVPDWFTSPASLSPAVDAYLRNTLGYGASLVITDSLSAVAVTSVTGQVTAAVDAIIAGNDMVIVADPPSGISDDTTLLQQIQSSLRAALQDGTITRQRLVTAVARKLQTQHIDPCASSSDKAQ